MLCSSDKHLPKACTSKRASLALIALFIPDLFHMPNACTSSFLQKKIDHPWAVTGQKKKIIKLPHPIKSDFGGASTEIVVGRFAHLSEGCFLFHLQLQLALPRLFCGQIFHACPPPLFGADTLIILMLACFFFIPLPILFLLPSSQGGQHVHQRQFILINVPCAPLFSSPNPPPWECCPAGGSLWPTGGWPHCRRCRPSRGPSWRSTSRHPGLRFQNRTIEPAALTDMCPGAFPPPSSPRNLGTNERCSSSEDPEP